MARADRRDDGPITAVAADVVRHAIGERPAKRLPHVFRGARMLREQALEPFDLVVADLQIRDLHLASLSKRSASAEARPASAQGAVDKRGFRNRR